MATMVPRKHMKAAQHIVMNLYDERKDWFLLRRMWRPLRSFPRTPRMTCGTDTYEAPMLFVA